MTILATGHRSEFGYDGLGRRVVIRELDPDASQNLQVTSDKKYLWDGLAIAQERSADGGTVLRQFYSQGFVDSDGTALFYTRDQLGSVRELTDGSQAVRARYDYDPYGRMTKLSGDRDSFFEYTGLAWHAPSGLALATYRAYDPNVGRWLSRDPIAEEGGINLYGYVLNNPINHSDYLGLCPCPASNYDECTRNAARRKRIRDYDIYKAYPYVHEDWAGMAGFGSGNSGPNVPVFVPPNLPFIGGLLGVGGFASSVASWYGNAIDHLTDWDKQNWENDIMRNLLLDQSLQQYIKDLKDCVDKCKS